MVVPHRQAHFADFLDRLDDLQKVLQSCTSVPSMDHDKRNGCNALSTMTLEPGDMLKDPPEMVCARVQETARKFHKRMETERSAREGTTRDRVKAAPRSATYWRSAAAERPARLVSLACGK